MDTDSTHDQCRDVGGCSPDCPWCAYPETLLAVMACCPACSLIMQATWNGVGTPCCEDCGEPLMISVLGNADAPAPSPDREDSP